MNNDAKHLLVKFLDCNDRYYRALCRAENMNRICISNCLQIVSISREDSAQETHKVNDKTNCTIKQSTVAWQGIHFFSLNSNPTE